MKSSKIKFIKDKRSGPIFGKSKGVIALNSIIAGDDKQHSQAVAKLAMVDTAREFLQNITAGELADRVSQLRFAPHKPHAEPSFYEYSILRGVRLDSVRLDSTLYCSFTVPARLTVRFS